ncbi:MAG: ATP-binding protein, partial [Armatimonadetes bacterium]|nr:ATP-binding protein [Armatimonadota bacterium]
GYLYGTFTSRRAMLFDRTTDESGVVKVELGERFIRGTTRRGVARYVAEGTRPNQLFLTEAADRNIGAAVAAIRFFRTGLLVIGAEAEYVPLEDRASADSDFVTFLSRQLRAMGTGVDEVRAERSDAALQGFLAGLTADDRTQLTDQVRQLKPGGGMQIRGPLGRMVLTKADTGEMVALILQAKHTTGAGDSVVFDLKDESDGTIRLVHLLPAWFELLRGNDVTVVVDELDRRLHPMLVRHLVRLWLECPREAGRGQLVFTTHDTGLLSLDLLRRDEVWFTEKDALGATDLYSLVEFRPRTGPGLEKGYLMGRFGAIPYLGDLHDGCPDAGVPAASETLV